MSCAGNNATKPSPAIAPGLELCDPRRIVEQIVQKHGPSGIDQRIPQLVPGFDAPFFQAGLAGYSDPAMRIIARRHGCPMCVTEALLDRTLLAGGKGFAKADLGEIHNNVPGAEEDTPIAGQIMGSEPCEMATAAVKLIEQGCRTDKDYRRQAYAGNLSHDKSQRALNCPDSAANAQPVLNADVPTFQVVDINLACPVKKIARKARGGHWLTQPKGAIRLLEAVREALPASIVTSLKIRRAYDDSPAAAQAFDQILDAAFDMGYAWATVHARTVQQKYVGPSRWDLLKKIVNDRPGRLIFGSGDIWTAQDIFNMMHYTGVTGASVARGCIGNPWIFRQAHDLLAGKSPTPPTLVQQRQVLEDHFALALAANTKSRNPENLTGRNMRKFAIQFSAHHPDAQQVKKQFIAISNQQQWQEVLDSFYPVS